MGTFDGKGGCAERILTSFLSILIVAFFVYLISHFMIYFDFDEVAMKEFFRKA